MNGRACNCGASLMVCKGSYVYMHMCVCVCTYICIYKLASARRQCVSDGLQGLLHMYICICVCAYIYVYIHMYIYIYMSMYLYIYM